MKKILLTGGGTAGHVTPNIALIPGLKELGYDILYVGSKNGIEKKLIEKEGIPFTGISTGKLRRYIDTKNLTDPFRVIHGYEEARAVFRKYKPDVVFSKGGYVSVPVVLAAKIQNVPVISHESDLTPGLANKITLPFVQKICCNFPETVGYFPEGKGVVTGCPIRKELLCGSREQGLALTGFDGKKPVLLVIGGSLGAQKVNEAVRRELDGLTEQFDVIHICGKGKKEESLTGRRGYVQYEYVTDDLKDLFAAADLFVSRAGANAICEIAALKKPNLLIPLGLDQSRGDQIMNARSFEKQGFSKVLMEEDIKEGVLAKEAGNLWKNKDSYIGAMEKQGMGDGAGAVLEQIEKAAEISRKNVFRRITE